MTIVEWVECMGVASGCGEQEVGVASGSGWNLCVWLLGVSRARYTITHFKHHHRVLWLISNRMSV